MTTTTQSATSAAVVDSHAEVGVIPEQPTIRYMQSRLETLTSAHEGIARAVGSRMRAQGSTAVGKNMIVGSQLTTEAKSETKARVSSAPEGVIRPTKEESAASETDSQIIHATQRVTQAFSALEKGSKTEQQPVAEHSIRTTLSQVAAESSDTLEAQGIAKDNADTSDTTRARTRVEEAFARMKPLAGTGVVS